jgi:hypothetical protein
MTVANFLRLSEGKWMTQRTIHKINTSKLYVHKSEVFINYTGEYEKQAEVSKNELERIFPDCVIQSMTEQYGTELFIPSNIFGPERRNIKAIHDRITCIFDTYANQCDHISLSSSIGQLESLEKLWFVNSNLRLGISIIKKYGKCIVISFTSDIKLT